MRSKRSRILIVFAIVFIMAITTGVAVALQNQTQTSTKGQTELGSPYIPVTLQRSIPSFTANDVKNVLHRFGFPLNPSVRDDRITSISFITAAQASLKMNKESVGLPPNALVCYVEFSGPIPLVRQSVPYGASVYTAKVGHIVIDASNGYLLVVGGI